MGNVKNIRVVLGSLRYKSAPNTDLSFQIPLKQTQKLFTEYNRSIDVNLAQVFEDERQKSNIFKPSCKFSLIFKNTLAGNTTYIPFRNNLYYINAQQAAIAECESSSNNVIWTGLPQYNEFDFIRNDYNVSGYTIPSGSTPPHISFVPKSANTYNWNFFLSYAHDNDYDKQLQAIENTTNALLTWKVSDGIPFIIERTTYNGRDIISFKSPIKHGMTPGEFVELKFSTNTIYVGLSGITTYEIYSVGNDFFGNTEYIFNILNIGYTGNTFNNGVTGTAKRVINNTNVEDTISQYYVRKHKILTDVDDAVLTKAGFEQNIFGVIKKFETESFTPNKSARVSVKEGSQSYTLSFNNDINIGGLLDNQKRPLSELFFTVVWKGYFGWMFKNIGGGGLKQGWEFNLPLKLNGRPSDWWTKTNSNSDTNLQLRTYNRTGVNGTNLVFCYIESLNSGNQLDGDICEWNGFEQKERVVSKLFHKLKFNDNVFSIESNPNNNDNPLGYYYQPHHKLTIRVFSDYIEELEKTTSLTEIPNYAYFSKINQTFRWRDLYTYGFVDTSGLGVIYPFLNNSHYPFGSYVFRLIPEGTNYVEETIIQEPTIDFCE